MVMGIQRSGTNALFHSLEKDARFEAFNENHPDVFKDFYLKSFEEVSSVIDGLQKPVLLKPISETSRGSLADLMATYRRYELHVLWIYRDPVNQIYSHGKHHENQGFSVPLDWYMDDYNQRNQKLLEVLEDSGSMITVVGYEHLCASRNVFKALCEKLKVAGGYLFREDSNSGYTGLEETTIARIKRETRDTFEQLNRADSFVPG